jgi:hypothetical protein
MTRVMLYAVLICTDEACAEELEAWGEIADLDHLTCDGCGCLLQAIAYAETDPVRVVRLPRRVPHTQLRNAA